ncbi:ABC transporter substrate-binding protein [Thermus thermamylovorans]|uniref:ABC transporter substrate-binding protein n=1 Tax=Thermus thermamylovorans TaxID=2509362 RepID=A0A4Q9B864_9DEIN|nr:ABC transporter substrate-binding protein [Thermus thermamylovorans]TBH21816.1 ABC transporter substrate-binding protein [Thermus thermamylovorans]
MRKILAFLSVLLALAFAFPLTLTDDLGRTVTVKAPPKRIVTMLPSVTETVCALGACERILATDDYSDWPEGVRRLPKAGGLYNPNPELIVSLRPDLVLVSKYGRLYETLERAGLAVYAVRTETYEDIFRTTRTLGRLLGMEAQAERLVAQIQRQVYAEESRAARFQARPRVYYEIDPTPYTVGPESFIGVLIQKARGVNIVPRELGLFPKIAPEFVVERNPEVIVATYPGALETIRARPGWGRVRAVQQGRICVFTGEQNNLLSRPGPRVAQGLRLLVDCFHGR